MIEGQDTGSRVSKNGDHSRRTAAIRFYLLSRRQFFSTKNRLTDCLCFKSSDTVAYTGLALKKNKNKKINH